jgi:hypothetical protein
VKEAVYHAPHLLPPIVTVRGRLLCRECSTAEVEKLLDQHDFLFVAEHPSDQELDEAIANFETALETLRTTIGYDAVCSECLFERTGLDRRTLASP